MITKIQNCLAGEPCYSNDMGSGLLFKTNFFRGNFIQVKWTLYSVCEQPITIE